MLNDSMKDEQRRNNGRMNREFQGTMIAYH